VDSIHNYRNVSIIRSIAGCFRFFTFHPILRPAALIWPVAALRHEAIEAVHVCYFQQRTFADANGKSGLGQ
jgi:hypothetical protein